MSRITSERLAKISTLRLLWTPIPDGALSCCNCGGFRAGKPLECGHAFCDLCEGRGRDDDHADWCAEAEQTKTFSRGLTDCIGCGQVHDDWESCAAEMSTEYERRTNTVEYLKEALEGWRRRAERAENEVYCLRDESEILQQRTRQARTERDAALSKARGGA